MSTFSATDSALAGFKLVGRKPMLVFAWTGLYLLLAAAIVGLAFALAGPALLSMAKDVESEDPSKALALLGGLWLLILILIPAVLIAAAMFNAAVFRSILRPSEKRFAYVALGADEWRILAVSVIYALLGGVVALLLVGGVVGATVAVSDNMKPLVAIVLGLVAFCAAVLLMVRFSLATAQTFKEGRINLFGSWALTRGRFWPMLGMWLLAAILAFVVGIGVTLASYIPVVALGGLSGVTQTTNPDFTAMTPAMIVGMALYFLIQIVGSVFQSVLTTAPAAAAVQQITGKDDAEAEIFA